MKTDKELLEIAAQCGMFLVKTEGKEDAVAYTRAAFKIKIARQLSDAEFMKMFRLVLDGKGGGNGSAEVLHE